MKTCLRKKVKDVQKKSEAFASHNAQSDALAAATLNVLKNTQDQHDEEMPTQIKDQLQLHK